MDRQWYRGDCHVHSARSHGADRTPAQMVAEARGLDFIAVTEHNTSDTYEAWVAAAGRELLVIPGQEVITPTGHWLALGFAPRQGWRDDVLDHRLADVREAGGLCVAAHPYAPYPGGTLQHPFDAFDLVEVWNGRWQSDLPWNADNEAALAEWGRGLAAGRWQPAIGNSDAHLAGQLGHPHTVVLADELSTSAMLDGLRAGRSWFTDSTDIDLSFEIIAGDRRAGIGDRLQAAGDPFTARLEVHGVSPGTVSFHTEQDVAHETSAQAVIEWTFDSADVGFVRVQVRHADGSMAAITNPVFVSP